MYHVVQYRINTSTGDRGRTDTLLLEPDFESARLPIPPRRHDMKYIIHACG